MAPPPGRRAVRPVLRPGDLLADRYRLERPVEPVPRETEDEESPAILWRAFDEVLARPVAVKVLRAAGRRGAADARPFLEAAARAGSLSVPVLARVYDAAIQVWPAERSGRPVGEVDVAYVISEWVEGQDLATVLRQDGPFEPAEAVELVIEIAEALHAAHSRGVAHERIHPGNVLLTAAGRPRLTDPSTSAALPGRAVPAERAGDPVGPAADVRDLTAVLYAMLTARWPASATPQPGCGVPAAPVTSDGRRRGRLTSPRQVRAGVPRALDELIVKVLQPSPGRAAPSTAAALADALAGAVRADAPRPAPAAAPVPSSRLSGLSGLPALPALPVVPEPVRRWIPLLASVGLLVTVGVGMYGVGRSVGEVPPAEGGLEAVAPLGPDSERIDLARARVRVFNPPPARGNERAGAVPNAFDDDPSTVWETERYPSRTYGGQKRGVGLLIDLGAPTRVARVELITTGGGATFELRAADELGAQASDYRLVARGSAEKPPLVLTPIGDTTARWYLIWVTGLRKADGGFSAGVAEMRFLRG